MTTTLINLSATGTYPSSFTIIDTGFPNTSTTFIADDPVTFNQIFFRFSAPLGLSNLDDAFNDTTYVTEPDTNTYLMSGSITGVDLSTTPLPASLPLLASGLGALGLLGWRRKRKAAALTARIV